MDSETSVRTRTGLALAAGLVLFVAFGALIEGGSIAIAILCTAAATGAAYEYATFSSRGGGIRWVTLAAIVFPVLMTLVSAYLGEALIGGPYGAGGAAFAAFVIGTAVIFADAVLHGRRSLERCGEDLSAVLAMALIGGSASAVVLLVSLPGGALTFGWLIGVVALNDIASYFAGRYVGGAKLAPAVSPGKTLSGAFGGMCGGVAAAFAISPILTWAQKGWPVILFAALCTILAAQTGDLAKSYLKRIYGVKDSGSLLPGHGGVLDRIDGMLLGGAVLSALNMLGIFAPGGVQ